MNTNTETVNSGSTASVPDLGGTKQESVITPDSLREREHHRLPLRDDFCRPTKDHYPCIG